MSVFAGVGFSRHPNAGIAADEAAQQAKNNLKQERIDLAIVFGTIHYNPDEFLPIIQEKLDHTQVIGCSTPAIMLTNSIEARGLGIMAIQSDTVKFESGYCSHLDLQDPHEAGRILANNTYSGFGREHRKLFCVLTDGLLDSYTDFIRGLKETFGNALPIIGAGSSDNFHFEKSYQLYHNKSFSKGAVGMVLGGRVEIGIGAHHGWSPLGKPRTIDSIAGPVIRTINGKPAINLYKEYFEKEASSLNTNRLGQLNVRYPLGILQPDGRDYLIRNVIRVLDDGGLLCQDNVPAGSEVHLMIGHKDSCLRGTELAALEVLEHFKSRPPGLILAFSSFTRYKLLGRSITQEIAAIRNTFGPIPMLGMLSCGEFVSSGSNPRNPTTKLHNGMIQIVGVG